MKIDDVDLQIARLELRPGDVLVVKVNDNLPYETLTKIGDRMRRYVGPDVKTLVIDLGIDLSVLSAEDIAARTAPA